VIALVRGDVLVLSEGDSVGEDGRLISATGLRIQESSLTGESEAVGVAMGITGTEVTKEAAALILADDNYATIVAAVRQGRAIFDNIRKFLRYLVSSNMGEVTKVFFGVVLAGAIGLTDASDYGRRRGAPAGHPDPVDQPRH